MKARHIKKLREKIKRYHRFAVRESELIIGSPFGKEPHIFLAADYCHAVERYLKWYTHKYRAFSSHHTHHPTICFNREFAHFEVYDIDKNFTYYVE